MKKTEFTCDFSKEIFNEAYLSIEDLCVEDSLDRVARALASVEDDPDKWFLLFREILAEFTAVTGGRILSNAGTGLTGASLINCFTSGPTKDEKSIDSMSGILKELERQAMTLKAEGGYGFCADFMRPRGSLVAGNAAQTPGPVTMLDMWDTQSRVITEGSPDMPKHPLAKDKIRKGAMMVTMSDWNPSILEFIVAKRVPGKLTKFNNSVLISDALMEAVEKNEDWKLIYPDFENQKILYDDKWNGNIEDWVACGGEVVVHKTIAARKLWNLIMESTFNYNDPGVIFVDTVNRLDNLNEHISTSNPCGEHAMSPHSICLLGSFNLVKFINKDFNDWDYDKLDRVIPIFLRMLDNVNDIAYVPLAEQNWSMKNKRRIGTGYMGYGSALMMLNLKYGSKKALSLTDSLGKFVTNKMYQASALLAKEKGAFPAQNLEEYLNSEFVKKLDKDTIELIRKYGTRNSHLVSIQPTGNTGIVANNVSGGLEPVFASEYIRTSIVSKNPEGLHIPDNISFSSADNNGNLGDWKWSKEGDEQILVTEFNGKKYKIDRNRGLTVETLVEDFAVRHLKENGKWDKAADWATTAEDLSIDDHVKTMEVFARYVDAGISKTINVPNNVEFDIFKDIYIKAWKTGVIKGFTTYRSGTRTSVLVDADKEEENKNPKILKTTAPKRPSSLPCDIHSISANGKKWVVIVGLVGGDPYEVFCFRKEDISIPKNKNLGILVKTKGGKYNLEIDDFKIKNIQNYFNKDEHEVVTRLISTSLRHGTPIDFIVQQMKKSHGTIVSFGKALSRVLYRYVKMQDIKMGSCPSCESSNYAFVEGCTKCNDCGYSGCG